MGPDGSDCPVQAARPQRPCGHHRPHRNQEVPQDPGSGCCQDRARGASMTSRSNSGLPRHGRGCPWISPRNFAGMPRRRPSARTIEPTFWPASNIGLLDRDDDVRASSTVDDAEQWHQYLDLSAEDLALAREFKRSIAPRFRLLLEGDLDAAGLKLDPLSADYASLARRLQPRHC